MLNWLLHNPIADMQGESFLGLYAAVLVIVGAVCWRRLRASDLTIALPTMLPTPNPDPLEIAYLKGGENEMLRLMVFALIQRGYLEIAEQKKWYGTTSWPRRTTIRTRGA